jgi:hypothetical protein
MQLIAIGASIDYRVEQRDGQFVLESSWSGFDEMDATSGRAGARIDDDTIRGKLFIHQGDKSTFVARRERLARRVSTSKGPQPPSETARHPQRGRPRQRAFRNSGVGQRRCARYRGRDGFTSRSPNG